MPALICLWEVGFEQLEEDQNRAELRLINIFSAAIRAQLVKTLDDLRARDEVNVERLLFLDHVGLFEGDTDGARQGLMFPSIADTTDDTIVVPFVGACTTGDGTLEGLRSLVTHLIFRA